MPEFTGFLDGPSYPMESVIAESSRIVNWRREPILSGQGKNRYALLRQPGLKVFVDTQASGTTVGSGSVRGAINVNGRDFRVIGNCLIEILDGAWPNTAGTGSYVNRSTSVNIQDDGLTAWMRSNPTQLAIVSGGHYYIYTYATNVLQEVTIGLVGTPSTVAFLDGFFILTFYNSQQYQISALNDGTTFDALDISSAESRPDYLVAAHDSKGRAWMFGQQTIQLIFNAGSPTFPFEADRSAEFNVGLVARDSVERNGDTLFFVGTGDVGSIGAYKTAGLSIEKISTFAIDAIFKGYKNPETAYGWCYSENGHVCWRITFPNIDNAGASRTWEYDDSLGPVNGWTEVPFYNWITGQEEAHRARCAAVSFGRILVGDRAIGRIYELNSSYQNDAGAQIRRVRRSPHVYKEKKRITYKSIEFDGNTGIGRTGLTTGLTTGLAACASVWACFTPVSTFVAALTSLLTAGTLTINQVSVLTAIYSNAACRAVAADGGISGANSVTGVIVRSLAMIGYTEPDNPTASLRWSDDGGRTWSDFVSVPFGKLGEYKTLPVKYRLGEAMDRVWELVVSESADWCLTACTMEYELEDAD